MTVAASESEIVSAAPRARRWLAQAAHFASWQGAAQALQLGLGLGLVHWLSYEAYAAYGLVIGFQNVMAQLVDLGFTDAILALVGTRVDEPARVGRYVAAAWAQRRFMMLLLGPISAVAFIVLARKQAWPLPWATSLFFSILAYLFFQGWSAIFSPVLLMHRQVGRFYRPRVLINALVLGAAGLLYGLGALGAAAVCWLSTAAAATTSLLYRRAAEPYLHWPHEGAPAESREMRRYLAPLWPGMLFYAFHGQIQLFLISVFGSTRSVAEVTALGRIGQLLVFVTAFVSTILVPMVARAPRARLARAYGQSLALVFAFCSALPFSALLFPQAYLFLLGAKYAGLKEELVLSVAASAAAFFASSLYVFNNARRWTGHGTVTASIVGAIAIDLAFIRWGNLGQVRGVLLLSVATNFFPVLPFTWAAWRGLRAGEEAAA